MHCFSSNQPLCVFVTFSFGHSSFFVLRSKLWQSCFLFIPLKEADLDMAATLAAWLPAQAWSSVACWSIVLGQLDFLCAFPLASSSWQWGACQIACHYPCHWLPKVSWQLLTIILIIDIQKYLVNLHVLVILLIIDIRNNLVDLIAIIAIISKSINTANPATHSSLSASLHLIFVCINHLFLSDWIMGDSPQLNIICAIRWKMRSASGITQSLTPAMHASLSPSLHLCLCGH